MDPDNTTTVSSSCCVAVRRDESVNSNLNFTLNVSSCDTYWEHLIVQFIHIGFFSVYINQNDLYVYESGERRCLCQYRESKRPELASLNYYLRNFYRNNQKRTFQKMNHTFSLKLYYILS